MKKEEKIKWDYKNEIHKPIVPGTILLSEPFMLDPSFNRSACVVVNHSKEEGTFSFILNKNTDQIISDIIDVDLDWLVYYGGPVETNALFYIHNNKFNLKNAIKITEGLYWHGDFEELLTKIKNGEVEQNDIRFFIGYSGWDGGQLRKEIIENSWIISNLEHNKILKDPKHFWANTLKEMGGVYKEFANFPMNPNLN